jgi:hypothetical protein
MFGTLGCLEVAECVEFCDGFDSLDSGRNWTAPEYKERLEFQDFLLCFMFSDIFESLMMIRIVWNACISRFAGKSRKFPNA